MLLAIAFLGTFPLTAVAQPAARFANWPAFESSADLKAYRNELATDGGFTDRHRQLLVEDGLPQLMLDANRDKLAFIRAQLPIVLLSKITSAAAFREATTAAVVTLDEMARQEKGAIEGSVNACLLLGELREQNGQLLAAATPLLCQLTLDAKVTPSVRVAALVGLRGRVAAAGSGSAPETKEAALSLLPTLEQLLQLEKPPAGVSGVVIDWLQQRGVDLATDLVPLAASDSAPLAAVGKAALELLRDADKPINLRVRAAVLLARLAKPDEPPLAAEIAELVDAVAVAVAQEDRHALKLIKLEQSLSGLDLQAGGPAMQSAPMMTGPMMGSEGEILEAEPSLLSEARCLQTSWRLASLAAALATIANSLGDAGNPYAKRADSLRNLGIEIYKSPGDKTVLQAADTLDPQPEPTDEPSDTTPAPQPTGRPEPAERPSTPFSPFQIR